MIIDLESTLKGSTLFYDKAKDRINFDFLAKKMVRGTDTVRLWVKGAKIPSTVIDRLIEVLEKNGVEIVYKD